jgi:hypothetical protein
MEQGLWSDTISLPAGMFLPAVGEWSRRTPIGMFGEELGSLSHAVRSQMNPVLVQRLTDARAFAVARSASKTPRALDFSDLSTSPASDTPPMRTAASLLSASIARPAANTPVPRVIPPTPSEPGPSGVRAPTEPGPSGVRALAQVEPPNSPVAPVVAEEDNALLAIMRDVSDADFIEAMVSSHVARRGITNPALIEEIRARFTAAMSPQPVTPPQQVVDNSVDSRGRTRAMREEQAYGRILQRIPVHLRVDLDCGGNPSLLLIMIYERSVLTNIDIFSAEGGLWEQWCALKKAKTESMQAYLGRVKNLYFRMWGTCDPRVPNETQYIERLLRGIQAIGITQFDWMLPAQTTFAHYFPGLSITLQQVEEALLDMDRRFASGQQFGAAAATSVSEDVMAAAASTKQRKQCTHCHRTNHTVDRCFVLHPELAPPGWKFIPGDDPGQKGPSPKGGRKWKGKGKKEKDD